MPHYLFHIRKDGQTVGYVGVKLANIEAARKEAVSLMAEEPKFKPDRLWEDQGWQVEVMDDRGLILFTIFSSAVQSASLKEYLC
jgi:hypothetical protein